MSRPFVKCTVPLKIGPEFVKFELRPDRHYSRVPVRIWKLSKTVLEPINPSELVAYEDLAGCIGMSKMKISVRTCQIKNHLILVCREPEPTIGLSTLKELQLVYSFGAGNFRLAPDIPHPSVEPNYWNEQVNYQERTFQQHERFSNFSNAKSISRNQLGSGEENVKTYGSNQFDHSFNRSHTGYSNQEWFDQSEHATKSYIQNRAYSGHDRGIREESEVNTYDAKQFTRSVNENQTGYSNQEWFDQSDHATKSYNQNRNSSGHDKSIREGNNLGIGDVEIVPWSAELLEEQNTEFQHSERYAPPGFYQNTPYKRNGADFASTRMSGMITSNSYENTNFYL